MAFGFIALGVGVLFGILGFVKLQSYRKIESYETRQGTVTAVLKLKRGKTKIKVPLVQLRVGDQIYAHQALNVYGSRAYHENQTVNVKWSEAHPNRIYIEGDNTKKNNSITLLVICAVFVVLGVILLVTA